MISGTQRASAQPSERPDDDIALPEIRMEEREPDALPTLAYDDDSVDGAADARTTGHWLFAATLALLAVAWIGFSIWAQMTTPTPLDPASLIQRLALVSLPLMLLALAWLAFGQSPRRETERFTSAIGRMREESRALELLLESVAARLDDNQVRLNAEAGRLMSLGEEAADRLGRVTHYLARESQALDRHSGSLEAAAANARVDLGVLLHDLPRAEEQVRAMGSALREAGIAAHEQAGALEGQVSTLVLRGREADDVVGSAAQRLGTHLARIESSAAAASERLDEAALAMTASVDGTLTRASDAIDQSRIALDAQGSALIAAVEQSRSILSETGDAAAHRLAERIAAIRSALDGFDSQLASQDAAGVAMMRRIGADVEALDGQFATLFEAGSTGAAMLNDSFGTVRGVAGALFAELGSGHDRAGALIDRMQDIARALADVSAQLDTHVPAALQRVAGQADEAATRTGAIAAQVASAEAGAGVIADRLSGAQANVERQSAALAAMAARLGDDLAAVEERLAIVRDGGMAGAAEMGEAFAGIRASLDHIQRGVAEGGTGAVAIGDRLVALDDNLAAITRRIGGDLPEALRNIEAQAIRSGETAGALAPQIEAMRAVADTAVARLAEAEASALRQREAIDALLAALSTNNVETSLRAIGDAARDAERDAQRLTASAAPALVQALLQVRETAAQSAERARETIEAVIPSSTAALAAATRDAVGRAISAPVEQQMGEVVKVAEAAVEAARKASERLTRQLMTIGEAAQAIEQRIEDARRASDEKESDGLSRHVALLIESLNSTAIDVTKILSNDVTDSAWAAYLKGDRGVFTRRAVRLLDAAEAREILRHYEEEPEFRDHVNRYVHDFETMMRRILADREGSPIGVAILSSDMGKLYVALAQAIDRLRR